MFRVRGNAEVHFTGSYIMEEDLDMDMNLDEDSDSENEAVCSEAMKKGEPALKKQKREIIEAAEKIATEMSKPAAPAAEAKKAEAKKAEAKKESDE